MHTKAFQTELSLSLAHQSHPPLSLHLLSSPTVAQIAASVPSFISSQGLCLQLQPRHHWNVWLVMAEINPVIQCRVAETDPVHFPSDSFILYCVVYWQRIFHTSPFLFSDKRFIKQTKTNNICGPIKTDRKPLFLLSFVRLQWRPSLMTQVMFYLSTQSNLKEESVLKWNYIFLYLISNSGCLKKTKLTTGSAVAARLWLNL